MRLRKPAQARPFVEGLAAFLIVFVAAELLRLSPRLAIGLSALAAIVTIYRAPLLAWWRSRRAPVEPPSALAAVLQGCETELARLRLAQDHAKDTAMQVMLADLTEAGEAILDQARQGALEPQLGARVLSYYLPRAADLAEAWPGLEEREDAARLAAARRLLERLLSVFRTAAAGLSEEALRGLDVDMRLLDQALEDDAGDRR